MYFLKRFISKTKRIYLDYAAATPVSPAVLKVMLPYFRDTYGNPSAIHSEGVIARTAIDNARKELARVLHVRQEGVVFTASGTESNNLAILGHVRALAVAGREYRDMEVLTTKIEHPSILECVPIFRELGVDVKYIDVDSEGSIIVDSLKRLLSKKTVLVVFSYANSEVGTIQDVSKLCRTVRAFERKNDTQVTVHLDAAQAPLWLSCEIDRLGVDVMALDAGKCEGPKGVGVLAFRHGVRLSSYIHGGGQEFGLRAGTENTPLIIGAAYAIVSAQASWKKRAQTAIATSERLLASVSEVEGVVLNGSPAFGASRLPNNINISISGIDTEYATIVLDTHGIAVSTKSACSGASGGGSSVVRAITGDEDRARSTLRMTHSGVLNGAECRRVGRVLSEHIKQMRSHVVRPHK